MKYGPAIGAAGWGVAGNPAGIAQNRLEESIAGRSAAGRSIVISIVSPCDVAETRSWRTVGATDGWREGARSRWIAYTKSAALTGRPSSKRKPERTRIVYV